MHVISCADWCAQSDAAPNSRVQDEWYPPGHGDIYRSLSDSGILDELIAQGKEYLFVSNIDNLGSVINYGELPPAPPALPVQHTHTHTHTNPAPVWGLKLRSSPL